MRTLRLLISLVVWQLVLGGCVGMAQGFSDFPVSLSTQTSSGASGHALPPQQMFDRYLAEQLSLEPVEGKMVFILVPESGCGYCRKEVVAFYETCGSERVRLIVATSSQPAEPVGHSLDVGSNCKRYGFGEAYPVIALVDAHQTAEVLHVQASKVEVQLARVRAFLE